MRRKLYSSGMILFLLLSLTACAGNAREETLASETEAPNRPRMTVAAEEKTTEDIISFETTDLEGNAVNSSDLFGSHKVTMVNIWGTFCGPCINEMPDLEILSGRAAEKDCGFIGIVCDIDGLDDKAHIDAAGKIIADTGVTYLNLLPWDGFGTALPAAFIPTTYFIDAEGKILGDPAVGARGADEYEALLDEVLNTLG